ncbi:hypothetical protein QE152_g34496 [Popillia japonica]|uniref:Uncharacterized protein n=1 Tax=Popillia japonica TaxID=7064 RepID=A0AAW1ITS4_POPJA
MLKLFLHKFSFVMSAPKTYQSKIHLLSLSNANLDFPLSHLFRYSLNRYKLTPGKPRKVGPPGDRTGERNIIYARNSLLGSQGKSVHQGTGPGKEMSKEILQKKEVVAVNLVDCAAIQGKDVRQRNQPVEPARKQDIGVRFVARRRRR